MFDYVAPTGPLDAEVCFFGIRPHPDGAGKSGVPLTSQRSGVPLRQYLEKIGSDASKMYFSNVIKTPGKEFSESDVDFLSLKEEFGGLKSKRLIVGLGKFACEVIVKAFGRDDVNFEFSEGQFFYLSENCLLLMCYHPSYYARKGIELEYKALDFFLNGDFTFAWRTGSLFKIRLKKGFTDFCDFDVQGFFIWEYTPDDNGMFSDIHGKPYSRKRISRRSIENFSKERDSDWTSDNVALHGKDFFTYQRIFKVNTRYMRVGYLDVETLYPKYPQKISLITVFDVVKDRFYSFSLKEKGHTVFSQNEKEVRVFALDRFQDFCEKMQFDVIIGWNVKFDKEMIEKGFKEFFHANRQLQWFDLLRFYQKVVRDSRVDYKLDTIAKIELGRGKIAIDKRKMFEMYENDYDKLLEYNIDDVYLTWQIDVKREILEFSRGVIEYANGSFYLFEFGSRILKHMLIRSTEKFIPDSSMEQDSAKFEGGYVVEPLTGVHENVFVFDMASLYPSIISTLNMGVETFCTKEFSEAFNDGEKYSLVPGFNYAFNQTNDSLLKQLCIRLTDERNKLRKEMGTYVKTEEKINLYRRQYAIKVLSNTIYGSVSDNRFFMFNRAIGESITAVGRANLKNLEEFSKKNGLVPIYGDTDALLLDIKGKTPEEVEKLLNAEVERFAKEEMKAIHNFMKIKYEKKYTRYLLVKKKKYAGMLENGKAEVKGFEFVRSDHNDFSRKAQKEMIDDILANGKVTKKFPQSMYDVVTVPLRQLVIPKKFDKDLDSYKGVPVHVRAARSVNYEFSKGETIYYLPLKRDKVVCTNFLTDEELEALRPQVDFKLLYENQIEHKLTQLLDLFKKQSSLGDWS